MAVGEFEITIRGRLGDELSGSFAGFRADSIPGNLTRLVGEVPDQAGLLSVLTRLEDLHVQVVSVRDARQDDDIR